jgi:hypothetical protein
MKNHQFTNNKSVKCIVCNQPKLLANDRIKQTGVCYHCTDIIIPSHIPKSQHIQYLRKKGYNKKPLFIN